MTEEENRNRLDNKLLLTVKRLTIEQGLTLTKEDIVAICVKNNYPQGAEERVARLFPTLAAEYAN